MSDTNYLRACHSCVLPKKNDPVSSPEWAFSPDSSSRVVSHFLMALPDINGALTQRELYRKALENPDMEQSQQRADLRFHLQAALLEWENYDLGRSPEERRAHEEDKMENEIKEFLKSPITSMTSLSDNRENDTPEGSRTRKEENSDDGRRWKDFLKKLDTKRNMLEERKRSTEGKKTIDEMEIRDLRREYMEELWVGAVALFRGEGITMSEDLIVRHNEFLANLYRPNLDVKEVGHLYTRFDELLHTYEAAKPRRMDESAGKTEKMQKENYLSRVAPGNRARSEQQIHPWFAAPEIREPKSVATVGTRRHLD